MVINPNFHISQRFISRERGYDMFVVCDMQRAELRSSFLEMEEIALDYPSVYFVNRDPIWSQIIEHKTFRSNTSIHILYYFHQNIYVFHVTYLSSVRCFIDGLLPLCDRT